MNVAYLLFPALVLYFIAHRFYAPLLARVFGEDNSRPTPAVTMQDGVDYVPTRPHVLFAHHFSAIAAAGPILGPTMALLYGYVPAFLWVLLGAVLIGAVHDYAALYVSMREGGRSIAHVARSTLGKPAFILFALFIIFNLVVVNAVFIKLTATSLTSLREPAALGLKADQTVFRTITGPDGKPTAVVGGIASTSAVALTIVAPLLGYFVVKRRMAERYSYPLATVLCIGSVLLGFVFPVNLPPMDLGFVQISSTQAWVVLISIYVWLAAAAPVWLILQPREFVSVQFLYLGIILLAVGLLACSIRGAPIQAPPADIAHGEHALGSLWPTLFITIACGAVSGFHGMVASGTTSKQVAKESHARHVGYLGMLGESALAMCVTLTIAVGVPFAEYYDQLIRPVNAPPGWTANPVLAFSLGVAGVCEIGLGIPKWLGVVFGLLMVEGFVLDTLDVSIRLNRYLLEEIWSIFGSGNQLLASLTLFTISVWLYQAGRRVVFVLVPAILVGITTVCSLVYLLLVRYLPEGKRLLATVDIVFIILGLAVLGAALRAALAFRRQRRGA